MFCIEGGLKYIGRKRTNKKGKGKMNDEEVRKLVERADAEFRALDKRMAKYRKSRFDFIFTKEEKKAWLEAEPNFPKPIIRR
jgi:hypothetical protein